MTCSVSTLVSASVLVLAASFLGACTSIRSGRAERTDCESSRLLPPYEAERQELRCRGLEETEAAFIAQASVDVRRLRAETPEPGSARVRLLTLDRQAKVAAFIRDAEYRIDYAAGDEDRDLVPDRRDRCLGTPAGTPTDSEGCGYDCGDLSGGPSRLVNVRQCQAATGRDGPLRDDADPTAIEVPINLGCIGEPAPSTSAPLGWTRVVLESGVVTPGTWIERRYEVRGLRFFVVKSARTGPSCELFYEFDVSSASAGAGRSANFLFSASEEVASGNPDIATFQLSTERVEFDHVIQQPPWPFSLSVSSAELPLSPGRSKAREVFAENAEVLWRVRAIDGMGKSSGWSELRKHRAGPDQTH